MDAEQMTDAEVMWAIEQRDPDHWENEPTAADYEKFKTWAVGTYGRDYWALYERGGIGN